MSSAINGEKGKKKGKQKAGGAASKRGKECMNTVCVLNHFIFVFLRLYNDLFGGGTKTVAG